MRDRLPINGAPVELAATGGLAIAGDYTDLAELYRRADLAMYQAKRTDQPVRLGVYSRTRDWAAPHAPTGATPAAGDGLEVVYQPIVALESGRAVAAEALLRWNHPEFGQLPPARALAVVERGGLLPEVTDTVLDQAITAARGWHQAGFPLQLAVNLSPRSLADPQFAPTLLSRLDKAGLHPRCVVVELHPADTRRQLEVLTSGLARLKDAGVQIALDDVTAEHTRLSTLMAMPVDQLKIDCSQIGDSGSTAAVALLSAIATFARRRGVTVVAYGVSLDRQREFLWRHGCALAQGTMFSRPVAADDLIRQLNRGFSRHPGVLAPPLTTSGTTHRGHRVHGLRHGLSH